jgi:hypothetical protein
MKMKNCICRYNYTKKGQNNVMNRIIIEHPTNRGIAQPGNVVNTPPPPQGMAPQQNIPDNINLYSLQQGRT